MITNQYIEDYTKNEIFSIISTGFLTGNFNNTILGQNEFEISSSYVNSMERTIPSNVIITAHILIKKEQLNPNVFEKFFENLKIDSNNACLILDYLLTLAQYKEDHNEIEIDVESTFRLLEKSLSNVEVLCQPLKKKLFDKFSTEKK